MTDALDGAGAPAGDGDQNNETPALGGDQGNGGATPHWSDAMPEEYRESVKGFDSWDAAKAALAGPAVPEQYAIPEGLKIDEGTFLAFTQVAKEGKFTQAQVDALLKFDAERSAALPGALRAEQDRVYKEGLSAMRTELGADRYTTTVKHANDALRKYADDSTVKWLKETGLANAPALVKLLANIGSKLQEDSPRSGDGSGTVQKDPAKVLYPNMA